MTAAGKPHKHDQHLKHQNARPNHPADLPSGNEAALDRAVTTVVNHVEGLIGLHPGERPQHGAADKAEDAKHEDLLFFAHCILTPTLSATGRPCPGLQPLVQQLRRLDLLPEGLEINLGQFAYALAQGQLPLDMDAAQVWVHSG